MTLQVMFNENSIFMKEYISHCIYLYFYLSLHESFVICFLHIKQEIAGSFFDPLKSMNYIVPLIHKLES